MIVVTTPTGGIGSKVVRTLLDAGASVRVIARDPSRLSDDVRGGVEIVAGSHADADVLDRALDGARALFWLVPPNPRAESLEAAYLDFTRPACDAIRAHGIGRVVGVSALGRGTPLEGRAGLVSASLAMDDLIASTGVHYRSLAMPSFMDNILRQAEPIASQGVFFSPLDPWLLAPTCATADIAAVGAELLLDHTWTGRADVPVLGPEDLSQEDMARIMSEVLGRTVHHQQVPFDAFEARLRANGMSEAFVRGYVEMMRAKNQGLDTIRPRTRSGYTPTGFRAWCESELKPVVERVRGCCSET